jgi:hypothetical protein
MFQAAQIRHDSAWRACRGRPSAWTGRTLDVARHLVFVSQFSSSQCFRSLIVILQTLIILTFSPRPEWATIKTRPFLDIQTVMNRSSESE